jgi:hypothetical protein
VLNYVSQQRKKRKRREAYLPLKFDPGMDAQVDWGEAEVEMAGERVMAQVFLMRLNYSRVRFVMAFPFQKQEAFLEGHVSAFHFLGGVPRRITYDNLKTAVFKLLEGHNRVEQEAFKAFRSHCLFQSNYCNRGQGHEKGGRGKRHWLCSAQLLLSPAPGEFIPGAQHHLAQDQPARHPPAYSRKGSTSGRFVGRRESLFLAPSSG